MKHLATLLLTCGLLLTGCTTNTATASDTDDDGFTALFDGETLDGWETQSDWFRIEDGAIVGGSLERDVTATTFLATTSEYYNFELRYELKMLGARDRANGGVQFRSARRDDGTGAIGYQADAGQAYWGLIYDEGRRSQLLTSHPEGFSIDDDINHGEWNDFVVRAQDGHLQVWINGKLVSDYHEQDADIAALTGVIMVQAHVGPPSEIWYRNLRIKELE
ncbi:MAG: DUF1080 domain-containing protein [Phycisphaerales bacterium JB063]